MKLLVCFAILLWCLGLTSPDQDGVFVMEGDSVTLNTGVQTDQDRIRWYFNDTLIAQINGKRETCTDVQCDEGNERFRGRLKLDHQTGSLTITNITNTDSGEYHLKIISSGSGDSEQIFSVTVRGVSAAERNKRKSVKEGESVTFDPGVGRKPNDSMTWYFNDTLIAEITGDQSKICTDVQCDERFRDRLKLDHQTGSLTITNTRTTDSGEYKLWINSSSDNSPKIFFVTVTAVPDSGLSTAVPDSGLSSGAVAGIVVAVVLVFAAAATGGVIYCRKHQAGQKDIEHADMQAEPNQENHLEDSSPDETEPLENAANDSSPNQTDTPKKNTRNGTSQNKIPLMNTANGTFSNPPEAAEEASL